MKSTFLCPYCLKKVSTKKMRMYCRKCKTVLPEQDIPFWKMLCRNHTKNAQVCPTCSKTTNIKCCPECNALLPSAIDTLPDMSIAIVGSQDSGKSHFIALLIKLLSEMGEHFILRPLNSETISRYEEQFYNPLFLRNSVIDKTQGGLTRPDLTKPLLYALKCRQSNRQILLAFFDTAGEDLEQGISRMETVNRYICTASGIICLLDPLQLEAVRRSLSHKLTPDALPVINMGTKGIVGNVVSLIKQYKMSHNQDAYSQYDIPFAVTVSKIDALLYDDVNYPLLFESRSPLFHEHRPDGYLNCNDFNTVNSLMHDWVMEADESIIRECEAFTNVAYFGFSALGRQTQTKGNARVLAGIPFPIRVTDPFFWILWENGLIPLK